MGLCLYMFLFFPVCSFRQLSKKHPNGSYKLYETVKLNLVTFKTFRLNETERRSNYPKSDLIQQKRRGEIGMQGPAQ